jgi:TetR/AcrR family transcriptional regulator, transcriptional repressor for nem operon
MLDRLVKIEPSVKHAHLPPETDGRRTALVAVRRFDEDAAMDSIALAFWARGYEGTSVEDLERATGLKRQSLYNAFGGKEAMFRAALRRYVATVAAPMRAALDEPDPRRGIAGFLEAHVSRMADPSCPAGCLLAGSCHELGGRGDALGRLVEEEARESEAALLRALAGWRAAGRLDQARDPAPLARYLVALVRGMAGVHRATGDVGAVRDAAQVGLGAVEPWLAGAAPRG